MKKVFNKDEGGAGGGGGENDVEEMTLEQLLTVEEGTEGDDGGEEGTEGDDGGEEGAAAGEEGKKKKQPEKKPDVALNITRFREVDDTIDTEDKLLESYKKTREENLQLRTLAQGQAAIEKDKDIIGWRQWMGRSDEELYQAELVNQYTNNGNLTKEAAIEKAKERLATAKEKNPQEVEDTAMRVRAGLKDAIQKKENSHIEELAKAGKTLDLTKLDDTTIDTARKQLSKTDNFLGMKISKNDVERKKMLSEVEKVMTSDDLQKALKDPEFLIQVALLRKFGPQYAAAIANRGSGKAKVVLGLPKAPASAGASAAKKPSTKTSDKSGKGFDPKNFK